MERPPNDEILGLALVVAMRSRISLLRKIWNVNLRISMR